MAFKYIRFTNEGSTDGSISVYGSIDSEQPIGYILQAQYPTGLTVFDDEYEPVAISMYQYTLYKILNPSKYGLNVSEAYISVPKNSTETTTDYSNNPITYAIVDDESTSNDVESQDIVLVARSNLDGSDPSYNIMKKNSELFEEIKKSTRVFGIPFHFTKLTDPYPTFADSDTGKVTTIELGREFIENIYSEAPIVYLLPGMPQFMPGVSKETKSIIDEIVKTKAESNDSSLIDSVLRETKINERYYDFIPAYAEYMKYVNLLCRACALYIGIGDLTVPGSTVKYKDFDWNDYQNIDVSKSNGISNGWGMFDALGSAFTNSVKAIQDSIVGDYKYIKCYIDPSLSVNDDFSNSTRESFMAGLFDQASDTIKEINFFSPEGSILGATRGAFQSLLGGVSDILGDVSGGDVLNFGLSHVLGAGTRVIQGANVIFPKVWGSSEYSKSISFTVTLVSPYGDPESIYLNIIAPMMHLIAMSLPRQVDANSYASPFLVRFFAKGICSCDLGIINSLRITKAGNGDAWTAYGLPTEVKIDISIEELYTNMMISKSTAPFQFFNNNGLIDFLAVTCGVNSTQPNFQLKVDTIVGTLKRRVFDIPSNVADSIVQGVRNAVEPWFKLTR